MNQLIYPSYEEEEPTGSLWAFQNPVNETLFAESGSGQNTTEGSAQNQNPITESYETESTDGL